jgi:hypothetical protein
MPKRRAPINSSVNVSCDNSCPPLKPIENSKYREINFAELAGISKSLFKRTAMMPKRKNKKAGLVRLLISKFKFI